MQEHLIHPPHTQKKKEKGSSDGLLTWERASTGSKSSNSNNSKNNKVMPFKHERQEDSSRRQSFVLFLCFFVFKRRAAVKFRSTVLQPRRHKRGTTRPFRAATLLLPFLFSTLNATLRKKKNSSTGEDTLLKKLWECVRWRRCHPGKTCVCVCIYVC